MNFLRFYIFTNNRDLIDILENKYKLYEELSLSLFKVNIGGELKHFYYNLEILDRDIIKSIDQTVDEFLEKDSMLQPNNIVFVIKEIFVFCEYKNCHRELTFRDLLEKEVSDKDLLEKEVFEEVFWDIQTVINFNDKHFIIPLRNKLVIFHFFSRSTDKTLDINEFKRYTSRRIIETLANIMLFRIQMEILGNEIEDIINVYLNEKSQGGTIKLKDNPSILKESSMDKKEYKKEKKFKKGGMSDHYIKDLNKSKNKFKDPIENLWKSWMKALKIHNSLYNFYYLSDSLYDDLIDRLRDVYQLDEIYENLSMRIETLYNILMAVEEQRRFSHEHLLQVVLPLLMVPLYQNLLYNTVSNYLGNVLPKIFIHIISFILSFLIPLTAINLVVEWQYRRKIRKIMS